MSGEREPIQLVCPRCQMVVDVRIDDLLKQGPITCRRGHALPGGDLRQSGLREVIQWLDAVLPHRSSGGAAEREDRR